MKKKILSLLGASFLISVTLSLTSFAAQWQQDSEGWWYQNEDGSYVSNAWQEIDGKRYHFDEKGYMDTGWEKLTTTRFNYSTDGSKQYYDTEAWYLFDDSGALVTEGNWDGGAIGPDGSLYIDNSRFEDGELFYQRSWNYGLPDAIGEPKYYHGYRGFYSCALPWKQELANFIDSKIGSEIGTYTIDYQLPETWDSECPKPLMSEMIRTVSSGHVEYINESQERSWKIDDNNMIHITIKRSLSN